MNLSCRLHASFHYLPMAGLGTTDPPYQGFARQCPDMVSDTRCRKPQHTTYLLRRNMTAFRYDLQYLPGLFADSFVDSFAVSDIAVSDITIRHNMTIPVG